MEEQAAAREGEVLDFRPGADMRWEITREDPAQGPPVAPVLRRPVHRVSRPAAERQAPQAVVDLLGRIGRAAGLRLPG
jgi:hypothetical protein